MVNNSLINVNFTGHNTDGKFLVTSNRLSFNFETSPKRIIHYVEKSKDGHVTPIEDVQITDVACGINHTVPFDYIHLNVYIDSCETESNVCSFCRLQSIPRREHSAGALVVLVVWATLSKRTSWYLVSSSISILRVAECALSTAVLHTVWLSTIWVLYHLRSGIQHVGLIHAY